MLFEALQRAGHALLAAQGFRARSLAAGGHHVICYDRAGRGPGPPLLLVHGLGGAATSWVALAWRLLPLCRRVRILDLPGHGRAARAPGEQPIAGPELLQAVGAALADLGEPAVLVGNSLGGALSLATAVLLPDAVAGVVGLSPAGAPLSEHDRGELRQAFRNGAEGGRELGRRLYHKPPRSLPLLAKGLGRHFGAPQVQALLDEAPDDGPVLPADELRQLAPPALVIWGASDRVLPRASVDYFRAALGDARVELWEETGHVAQMEQPVRVARRLARFLDEVRAEAQRRPRAAGAGGA